MTHKSFLTICCLWFIAIGLLGCATNPVTGRSELNIISESWELKTGKQHYLPMRQSQGGDYVADPKVQDYVRQVGNKLAAVSDRKLPYEFSVVNDSSANAWALPGGKIAIHRGLLTELKSEAELAAVLSHEIVHAAAKHGAKSMQRGMLLQSTIALAGAAAENSSYTEYAERAAELGATLISTKYGRDAERESDLYGMNYMTRAGYDPMGAVDLQQTFVNISRSRQSNALAPLFASHPPSKERLASNRAHAATLPKGGARGTARYQQVMQHLRTTKPAYQAYEKGTAAFAEADFTTAQALAKTAIKIEPNEAHFFGLLGDIASINDRVALAQRHYRHAIRLNDRFFYPHLQSGLISKELGELDAAKASLKRSIALLPTASAHNALGEIAESEGNLAQAKEYFAAASEDNGEAGQAAQTALIRLNVAENAGAYITTTVELAGTGEWVITLHNTAPRDFTDLTLVLAYADQNGRVRRQQLNLRGHISAQNRRRIYSGLTVKASLYPPQVSVSEIQLRTN